MDLKCQDSAIDSLSTFAAAKRHSILISGMPGSGKTYLANEFAKILGLKDSFQVIEPKVNAIRECIEACTFLSHEIVICIENLDTGVAGASYALLKFLEEPSPNVYIVVTARNLNFIPDTIISRSVTINLGLPTSQDLQVFAESLDAEKYVHLKDSILWRCVRTLQDAQAILKLDADQISYYQSLAEIVKCRDTVSNIIWKLSHYPDNSETPIEYVIRYVMELVPTPHVQRAGIECIRSLTQGRIASHATIAKFVFELKYIE